MGRNICGSMYPRLPSSNERWLLFGILWRSSPNLDRGIYDGWTILERA